MITMKEITVFIIIVILALAFLVFILGTNGTKATGASILDALRFNYAPPHRQTAETKNTKPESQPKTNPPQTKKPEPEQKLKPAEKPNITISGIRQKTGRNPSVITLNIYSKEKTDITGFTIKTRHGEFKIPQGVEKYQEYKDGKDIFIEGYINIYIIGTASPLNGQNFRLNKCLGYLKEYISFYPSFSNYCPRPKQEEISYLLPVCQDYIIKLRTCQIPNYSGNLKISSNSNCASYINENLNYSGCYNKYNQDKNFLQNYWYIYNKSDIVEPLHDIIYLYDKNGSLIDSYNY